MRAIALLLVSFPLWAATTVSDTIKDASGRPVVRGSVTFTPTATFQSGSNANWVSQSPVSAIITNGVFTVSLEPTPAGACYNVTFQPPSVSPPQLAAVPVSSGTLTLSQIINATGCALGVGTGKFADADPPTGTMNGTNTTFTLAHVPSPPASLILTLNGLAMQAGADYTLSGSTITFIAPSSTPQSGDILQAWYRY